MDAFGPAMTLREVAGSFHVTTVDALLSLPRMARYQDVRAQLPWLAAGEPPLGLLFVSHRWASPEHPDPGGDLMRGVQEFLRLVLLAVEALLVPREGRLRVLSSISREGALQAEEVARRLLGYGPFAGAAGAEARRIVAAQYRSDGEGGPAFGTWLAQRIGVWLDYVCMPQRPLSREDEPEFDRALQSLDRLAQSAILLAMREPRDDYAVRGWCLLESFVGSGRSFARAISIDIRRMEGGEEAAVPPPPVPAMPDAFAMQVMREAYEQDLAAYREACERWATEAPAFVQHVPPDAWSAYRSLQGSAFPLAGADPNPFRPGLELVRELETALIERWLMAQAPLVLDLGAAMSGLMARHGVRCADADQLVLGFTLACNGWMAGLRPLFRECLRLACLAARSDAPSSDRAGAKLAARLLPIDPATRALFEQAQPASPHAWYSRLSQGSACEPAAKALLAALEERPPRFEMPYE
jgi:hypothetical protein